MPALNLLLLLFTAALACLPGCATQTTTTATQPADASEVQQATEPSQLTVPAQDYAAAFEAARAALREADFTIDRQDYRFGVITTKPNASPTVFEVWEQDNSTTDQMLSSTINHERRIVRLLIKPATKAARHYTVSAEVLIERRELPLRRVIGSSYHRGTVFNRLSDVPGELLSRGVTEPQYWSLAGRDPEMSARLIASVQSRLSQHAANDAADSS